MQDNKTGTWLARDGDGRVLEVDADGCPAAEASSRDGRPVAEAEYKPMSGGGLDVGRFAAYRDGPIPSWEKTEAEVRDWEAEAG
jgi:hypothetical protein